jgi:hypothetical protein
MAREMARLRLSFDLFNNARIGSLHQESRVIREANRMHEVVVATNRYGQRGRVVGQGEIKDARVLYVIGQRR